MKLELNFSKAEKCCPPHFAYNTNLHCSCGKSLNALYIYIIYMLDVSFDLMTFERKKL